MWINTMLDYVEATDVREKILEDMQPNEEPIAVLSEDLRKMSTYLDKTFEEITMMRKQAEDTDSKRVEKAILDNIERLMATYDLIRNIFWHEIRVMVATIPGNNTRLRIRKGWTVVREIVKREPVDTIAGNA